IGLCVQLYQREQIATSRSAAAQGEVGQVDTADIFIEPDGEGERAALSRRWPIDNDACARRHTINHDPRGAADIAESRGDVVACGVTQRAAVGIQFGTYGNAIGRAIASLDAVLEHQRIAART